MKKIFKIAQHQKFKVKVKKKQFENGYCVRGVKYIYCENEEKAIELYRERYKLNLNPNIEIGWGDWEECSHSVTHMCFIGEDLTCTIVNLNLNGTETIEDIKKNMFGVELKEWWNDEI